MLLHLIFFKPKQCRTCFSYGNDGVLYVWKARAAEYLFHLKRIAQCLFAILFLSTVKPYDLFLWWKKQANNFVSAVVKSLS